MILSYEQIKAIMSCADCARREVTIISCADFDELHDVVLDEMGICMCALRDHMNDIPCNVVETLHDPGCPKIGQVTPSRYDEIQIHPIDLSDEHPWVLKAKEAAGHE
jgi:hypothetical protein